MKNDWPLTIYIYALQWYVTQSIYPHIHALMHGSWITYMIIITTTYTAITNTSDEKTLTAWKLPSAPQLIYSNSNIIIINITVLIIINLTCNNISANSHVCNSDRALFSTNRYQLHGYCQAPHSLYIHSPLKWHAILYPYIHVLMHNS